MSKRTAKLIAAMKTAVKVFGRAEVPTDPHHVNSQKLYDRLALAGYWWDAKENCWDVAGDVTHTAPGNHSMFADSSGKPSGIYRLRVMAHPGEIDAIVAALVKHITVLDVSVPYPNRNGVGVRVYITAQRSRRK